MLATLPQTLLQALPLTCVLSWAAWRGYQHLFLPAWEKMQVIRWKNTPRLKHAEAMISALYQNTNGFTLSRLARAKQPHDDLSFIYGEASFLSFAAMLEIANPPPGAVFYDLGSGIGNVVITAALLHDFSRAYGVEILPALVQASRAQLTRFHPHPLRRQYYPDREFNLHFIQGDLLEQNIADADLIYINATCFISEFWQAIVKHLESIKPGTRLIILSRQLPPSHYQLIDQNLRLMSWGAAVVSIYEKIAPSTAPC